MKVLAETSNKKRKAEKMAREILRFRRKIMESSSISSPQTFSKTAGSKKRKRDSGEEPKTGVEGPTKKRRIFLRDPRISLTDLSRPYHPVCQNVKNNEPNHSRGEEEEVEALLGVPRSEYCQDYYFKDGGCKNAMCPFAHGDCEHWEPFYMPPKDAIVFRPLTGETEGRTGKCETCPFMATMFPYIDASHAGILFGQRGEIFQWLCNLRGVKVTVENNKKLPGFKKVVISGSLSACLDAQTLLRTLLENFVYYSKHDQIPPVLDYKAELCKKYGEGCCELDAERCCFAHGESELRPRSTQLLERAFRARREGKNRYHAATNTFVRVAKPKQGEQRMLQTVARPIIKLIRGGHLR